MLQVNLLTWWHEPTITEKKLEAEKKSYGEIFMVSKLSPVKRSFTEET